jgi:hypothetical protein
LNFLYDIVNTLHKDPFAEFFAHGLNGVVNIIVKVRYSGCIFDKKQNRNNIVCLISRNSGTSFVPKKLNQYAALSAYLVGLKNGGKKIVAILTCASVTDGDDSVLPTGAALPGAGVVLLA